MCLGTLAHKCPKHMFFLSFFFFFFLFFPFSCCFSLDRPSVVFSLIICAYFTLSLSLPVSLSRSSQSWIYIYVSLYVARCWLSSSSSSSLFLLIHKQTVHFGKISHRQTHGRLIRTDKRKKEKKTWDNRPTNNKKYRICAAQFSLISTDCHFNTY